MRQNQRYFWAVAVLFATFVINRSFPADIITSEVCASGNCETHVEDPNLTDKNPAYYANDVFNSKKGEYYRLFFRAKANKEGKLVVSASDSIDTEKRLEEIDLMPNGKDDSHEIIFPSDNQYSDILFEKADAKDGTEISISEIQVSKLNVSNEKEFQNFQPTIKGDTDYSAIDQKQLDESKIFDQLKDPGMILGQIFKPQSEYISSVTMDADIIKQDNNGGKKYKFELREATFDGRVPEVTSRVKASVDFTSETIENYRKSDGKLEFPIFLQLDKDKYYFLGINNNNVAVDKYNYLRMKGSGDPDAYPDGMAIIKTKGKTYSAIGNLYFETHGINFSQFDGTKVLSGEIIEDLGKGMGKFNFHTGGKLYDLVDLFSHTPDVNFDDGKKALFGQMSSGNDSEMVYKFETIFPVARIRLTGEQGSPDWTKSAVSYSFDGTNWNEIPSSSYVFDKVSGIENFDYAFSGGLPMKKEFYIKIAPKEFKEGARYGIKKFKIEADLTMRTEK